MSEELIGKKLFYKESKIGEIISVQRLSKVNLRRVAIIETTKNDYKAAPLECLIPEKDKVIFCRDRSVIDNFPKLSGREVAKDSFELKNALVEHYGEPKYWDQTHDDFDSSNDQAYMGSSDLTNQAPDDNASPKDEVDFDKIKGS